MQNRHSGKKWTWVTLTSPKHPDSRICVRWPLLQRHKWWLGRSPASGTTRTGWLSAGATGTCVANLRFSSWFALLSEVWGLCSLHTLYTDLTGRGHKMPAAALKIWKTRGWAGKENFTIWDNLLMVLKMTQGSKLSAIVRMFYVSSTEKPVI